MSTLLITWLNNTPTNIVMANRYRVTFKGELDFDGGTINVKLPNLKPMSLVKIGFELGQLYPVSELDIQIL